MTVLVTGGAGYIGSHMVLELLEAGEKVVVLDNLSTGFRWAVPASVPLVVGDFGDEDLVTETLARYDVESIVHFAAKIVVPDSVTDPLGYYLNNTAKARTLIECAVDSGVRNFIFSSTAAVYGDPQHNPVMEDEPLKPLSPYGRSKLMVEWMLQDAANAHDLHYAVLRYFNVAGADPKGRAGQSTAQATHLIKVAVQAALGHRPGMELFGTDYATPDGSCVRDYIQVSDLAAAHMDALRYLRAGGENITCNCGYAHGYSVLEVIDVVKKVSGVDFPVKISGRRAGDPAAIVAGNDKIKSVLGWTPKYDDLEQIVRQALHWEQHLHRMGTANSARIAPAKIAPAKIA
ncbi:UDP-glucose 4-epimerase GalE [Roseiarcaceae bacterium H3SJ34-1]|uniref:UDP-glucose 4-epimerase GalE n=1 Tax=Terripilifer ovatus TaxID=3032367 RepID=UPI003AB9BA8B|nr:UDP-glucose 4-epimerase GalE [Roseiarcaceae bacterium H3SJ34-1]